VADCFTPKVTTHLWICVLALIVVCILAGGQQAAAACATPSGETEPQSQSTASKEMTPPKGSSTKPIHEPAATGVLRGLVRDSAGRPAADAYVFLDHATEVPGTAGTPTQAVETLRVHTTGKGAYRFSGLAEGSYILRAQRSASERTARTRVKVGRDETKTVDLEFLSPKSTDAKTD
jgi:hypothetical protein